MQLKPQTLMVAIQCVAAEIKSLDRHLNEEEPPNAGELEQLLVSFDLAADDLKLAYQDLHQKYGELPTYEELISRIR
ncbi:hypothetical protein [Methylomonas methanica]|uniref:Uncharacterized protein n=1 Tax=Methylomonas methanica (strain DSM 25384 / MC09) TaxID=857087 RepID=G0A730_METMM|nr:hypothetical protein [Methylomonas methanica]AEG01824.1 hypothetical protein Metme_3456 [Methylomonas methanica MC09]